MTQEMVRRSRHFKMRIRITLRWTRRSRAGVSVCEPPGARREENRTEPAWRFNDVEDRCPAASRTPRTEEPPPGERNQEPLQCAYNGTL